MAKGAAPAPVQQKGAPPTGQQQQQQQKTQVIVQQQQQQPQQQQQQQQKAGASAPKVIEPIKPLVVVEGKPAQFSAKISAVPGRLWKIWFSAFCYLC